MNTFLAITGMGLSTIALIFIILTLIDIQKEIGASTTSGVLWILAVIFGSVFGVFLYRFMRIPTEQFFQTLFERHR